MPGGALRASLAAALVLGAACSSDKPAPPASTSSAPQASPTAAGCEGGCWQEIRPLGSGGFPPAPGSRNEPAWKPGLFPLTLTPHLAFDGHLWMTAQTVAYSSPDGLAWTEHPKTDWGGRIYHAVVYFRDRLWMFGGLDYQSRSFRNDIWSSADGRTWERAGTAPWPARGQHAVVAHQGRLWLLGGADRVDGDRSADRFLNDVWVSEDGIHWSEVTDHAPWTARGYPGALVLGDDLWQMTAGLKG